MGSRINAKCGEAFGQFKHMFPSFYKAVTYYGPWSESAVRIELEGGTILLFEYRSPKNWMLSTEENELIRLEGRSRMKQVTK